MRTTKDTHTGRTYRFNDTVQLIENGQVIRVPARRTRQDFSYLHSSKVQYGTLRDLNPGTVILHRAGEASNARLAK